MNLVNARHDVYGVVRVPESYAAKWPDQYTIITDEQRAEESDRRNELEAMTVADLDALLAERGLDVTGVKAVKVDALLAE